jgi:hypothetical protein
MSPVDSEDILDAFFFQNPGYGINPADIFFQFNPSSIVNDHGQRKVSDSSFR